MVSELRVFDILELSQMPQWVNNPIKREHEIEKVKSQIRSRCIILNNVARELKDSGQTRTMHGRKQESSCLKQIAEYEACLEMLRLWEYPQILNNEQAFNIIANQKGKEAVKRLIDAFSNSELLQDSEALTVMATFPWSNPAYLGNDNYFIDACQSKLRKDKRALKFLVEVTRNNQDGDKFDLRDVIESLQVENVRNNPDLLELTDYPGFHNIAHIFSVQATANDSKFIKVIKKNLQAFASKETTNPTVEVICNSDCFATPKILPDEDWSESTFYEELCSSYNHHNAEVIATAKQIPFFNNDKNLLFSLLAASTLIDTLVDNLDNPLMVESFKKLCQLGRGKQELIDFISCFLVKVDYSNNVYNLNDFESCRQYILDVLSHSITTLDEQTIKDIFSFLFTMEETKKELVINAAQLIRENLSIFTDWSFFTYLLNKVSIEDQIAYVKYLSFDEIKANFLLNNGKSTYGVWLREENLEYGAEYENKAAHKDMDWIIEFHGLYQENKNGYPIDSSKKKKYLDCFACDGLRNVYCYNRKENVMTVVSLESCYTNAERINASYFLDEDFDSIRDKKQIVDSTNKETITMLDNNENFQYALLHQAIILTLGHVWINISDHGKNYRLLKPKGKKYVNRYQQLSFIS